MDVSMIKENKKNKKISKIKNKINKIFKGEIVLNSRYTVSSRLGKGGLCNVYSAKDIYGDYFNDDTSLAIKIPIKTLLIKNDIAAFIYSEYKFLKQLSHDNIVKVYDYGIDIDTKLPYIIMENIEGDLLHDMPLYKMKKDFKTDIYNQAVATLKYIHSKGIVHADINPKNVIISDSGIFKFFDFGISQNTDTQNELSLNLSNSTAYNPKYSAPEILAGNNPSIESDIFSLACMFYEIFSLSMPYKKSPIELEIYPLTFFTCSKKIPMGLRMWFVNCLSPIPLKRRRNFAS